MTTTYKRRFQTMAQKGSSVGGVGLVDYLALLRRMHPNMLLSAADERKMARRMHRGCQASRERLIVSQLPWIVRIASQFSQRANVDADELVAAANCRLCREINGFDPDKAKLSTWTYWIARNEMINVSQRAMRESGAPLLLGKEGIDPHYEVRLDEAIDSADEMARVMAEIDDLPPMWQAVMRRRLDGATFQTIGDELGFCKTRAGQVFQQAVRRLRTRLGVQTA